MRKTFTLYFEDGISFFMTLAIIFRIAKESNWNFYFIEQHSVSQYEYVRYHFPRKYLILRSTGREIFILFVQNTKSPKRKAIQIFNPYSKGLKPYIVHLNSHAHVTLDAIHFVFSEWATTLLNSLLRSCQSETKKDK